MSGEQFDGTSDDVVMPGPVRRASETPVAAAVEKHGRERRADGTGRRDNASESAPTAPRQGGAFEIDADWESLSDDEKNRAVDEMLTDLARRMNIQGTAENE